MPLRGSAGSIGFQPVFGRLSAPNKRRPRPLPDGKRKRRLQPLPSWHAIFALRLRHSRHLRRPVRFGSQGKVVRTQTLSVRIFGGGRAQHRHFCPEG